MTVDREPNQGDYPPARLHFFTTVFDTLGARQDDMALTQESLLSFLLERGGKVTNSELLSNFRSRISGGDPAEKQHNRELFKRLVNSVAVVKQTDGLKFVCVKKRYQDFLREFDTPQLEDSFSSRNSSFSCTSPHRVESDAILNSGTENNNYTAYINRTFRANGKHAFEERSPEKGPISQSMSPTTVKVLNLTGDQRSLGRKSGALFAVIAVKSPPRDCAQSTQSESKSRAPQPKNPGKPFVSMTNFCAPTAPSTDSSACKQANSKGWKDRLAEDAQLEGFTQLRPQSKAPRQGDDAKYLECVPLEPLAHDWLVKCAAGRWGQIYSLLLQDMRLAQKKDFMSGFTVLHWAAKDGNHRMIQKIVDAARRTGAHVDVNCKAHGGYTPLHIAAIHGHAEVIVLLVKSYGARINERDNNGKKAFQYLAKGASVEIRALLGGQQHGNKSRQKTEDNECRENAKGFNSISKLFQPHIGKKHKTSGKFAQDW